MISPPSFQLPNPYSLGSNTIPLTPGYSSLTEMLWPARPFPKMRPDPGLFDLEPICSTWDLRKASRDMIAVDMRCKSHVDRPNPPEPVKSTTPLNADVVGAENGRVSSHTSTAPGCPAPVGIDKQLSELRKPANGTAARPVETVLQQEVNEEKQCLASSNLSTCGTTVESRWRPESCRDEQGLCSLHRPGSSRPYVPAHSQTSNLPSPKTPRRRRWSTGACPQELQRPRLSTNQSWSRSQSVPPITSDASSKALPIAARLRKWCEELCRKWTQGFSDAYWDLGQVWKGVCFAQFKGGNNLVRERDKALRAGVQHVWQPLADFHYVVQIYCHLSTAQNYKLHPELTTRYLDWMTPEQMGIYQDRCSSLEGEDWASVNGARGDSGVLGYPLTTRQLFQVARICNDAEWAVKLLSVRLDAFKHWRAVFVWADEQRRNCLRPLYAQRCIQSTNDCLRLSKGLVAELQGSPALLCNSMGLDPAKVPSCCYPGRDGQRPHMSGAVVVRGGHVPRGPGGPKLPRSFGFQRVSLQIGRIALVASVHAPFLSLEATRTFSRRMLALSEKLANEARKAGEWKMGAKVQGLSKRIRDVSERKDQGASPETISLLDSVTWLAVLEPRSGGGVKTYDELASVPLDTLLDNLDSLLAPAKGA